MRHRTCASLIVFPCTLAVLLFALVLAVASAQVFDQPCGTEMSCQSGQSCCTSEVATGCCPFENGVCCSDGFHCCPANGAYVRMHERAPCSASLITAPPSAVCDSVTGTCRTTGNFFSEVPLQRTVRSTNAFRLPLQPRSRKLLPPGLRFACFSSRVHVQLPALHAPAVLRQFVAKLQGAATVKDCGDSSYLAHFDSTTLSPTTPVKGKQVDMTGAASATNAFTGGKYKMVAKMSGVRATSPIVCVFARARVTNDISRRKCSPTRAMCAARTRFPCLWAWAPSTTAAPAAPRTPAASTWA